MFLVMIMIIGQRIRFAREEARLTQAQLAKMARMSRVTLGRYEAGQRTLTVEAVTGIAEALGIPVEKLLYPDMWQENEMPMLPNDYDDTSLANLSGALDRRSHKIADFIECLDKLNEKGQEQFIKRMKQVFEDMQHNPAYRRKRQSASRTDI